MPDSFCAACLAFPPLGWLVLPFCWLDPVARGCDVLLELPHAFCVVGRLCEIQLVTVHVREAIRPSRWRR
jgi:hypothetical protein